MSKFLNVPFGDYTITVRNGGEIRLDAGLNDGEVVVVGNLTVLGEQTTIESTISTINDNILVLNDGETSNGISLGQSGIEVDRGTFPNARLVFDEAVTYTNPSAGSGAWSFEDSNGTLFPIQTNQIVTGSGNLNLINAGNGVISVEGTNNYEENVFVYSSGTLNVFGGPDGNGCVDNDYIPNAKGIADYMDSYFAAVFQDRIEEGSVSKTYVETLDQEVTGEPSRVDIGVDSQSLVRVYANRTEIEGISIADTKIETFDSDSDLVLSAAGSGSVVVRDSFVITETPGIDDVVIDPSAPTDGVKIYSKPEDTGNTGLYFVNSSSTRDEMISNNRALVYSMLF